MRTVKALLHGFEQMLVLPSRDPPLWARRALAFERAVLARGSSDYDRSPRRSASSQPPQIERIVTRESIAAARFHTARVKTRNPQTEYKTSTLPPKADIRRVAGAVETRCPTEIQTPKRRLMPAVL